MNGVRSALNEAAARRMRPETRIPLRGPAGLFKSIEMHRKCWGLLDDCNANITLCPIDVITFHRKGVNTSNDVLTETIDLLEKIHKVFPNLSELPFSNSEADPTSGWSRNVTLYADVHYSHMLLSIVFQHWNAYSMGLLHQFESISHDNSFLSYHPFEFSQRTLLARFMMNETHPKSVIFIQKPVYAALGMLSSLTNTATKFYEQKKVSYLISLSKQYVAALLLSAEQDYFDLKITMSSKWNCTAFVYFAEFIDQERTNPYAVWSKYNKPSYPNDTVLFEMRRAQVYMKHVFKFESKFLINYSVSTFKGPHMLDYPKVLNNSTTINFEIKLSHPWVVLLRICAMSVPQPTKVKNIRIHMINRNTVLITWNENEYKNYERCIRTYEIHYTPKMDDENVKWHSITHEHIPFLSYCYHISGSNQRFQGNFLSSFTQWTKFN